MISFVGQIAYAQDSITYTRREIYITKMRSDWNRLIPRYTKMQFAGGMGVLSLGVGWDYGKRKRWESDLFLGYLPKFVGKNSHLTFTIKQNYIPWKWRIRDSDYSFEPFTSSIYLNWITGNDYWTHEPDKYPNNYYSVSTNLRVNLAFGQRFTVDVTDEQKVSKTVSLYYELCTNDLYIISWATNEYITISDIFSFSIGLKFQFL